MTSPVKTRKPKTLTRKRKSVSPRQRRTWLQKAALCQAALDLAWRTARMPKDWNDRWVSLCWVFADLSDRRSGSMRSGLMLRTPAYGVFQSILKDLAHEVDESGTWGLSYSFALDHPSTSKGYHARRKLLLRAIAHYQALAEGKAPVLKLRPCYKHLA